MSLKKIDYALKNLKDWEEKLRCPLCQNEVESFGNSLVCLKDHQFDLSKQGSLVLQKDLKEEKLYTRELFLARRKLMQAGFFNPVNKVLNSFIEENDYLVDMGSGEGTHDSYLKSKHILGIDLAKEGIKLATDFNHQGLLNIVADLSRMPLKDESVDCVLNILSPSNEAEMNRVLKNNGTVIKVLPRKNYLKELRMAAGLELYKELEVDFKILKVEERIPLSYNFQLDEELSDALIAMTPLSKHKVIDTYLESISVDLEVLILRKVV